MAWLVEQAVIGQTTPVADFIATLSQDDKTKIAALLVMLSERGNTMKMPQSRALGQGLYELRTKTGVRLFYIFRPGQRIVLLGGMVKKRDDIPAATLKMMRDRAKGVP